MEVHQSRVLSTGTMSFAGFCVPACRIRVLALRVGHAPPLKALACRREWLGVQKLSADPSGWKAQWGGPSSPKEAPES
eukprot:jgi/Botrbrau1/4321/Bobra.0232s0013.1